MKRRWPAPGDRLRFWQDVRLGSGARASDLGTRDPGCRREFAPSGHMLATSNTEGTRLWDAAKGELLVAAQSSTKRGFSPDGRRLAFHDGSHFGISRGGTGSCSRRICRVSRTTSTPVPRKVNWPSSSGSSRKPRMSSRRCSMPTLGAIPSVPAAPRSGFAWAARRMLWPTWMRSSRTIPKIRRSTSCAAQVHDRLGRQELALADMKNAVESPLGGAAPFQQPGLEAGHRPGRPS